MSSELLYQLALTQVPLIGDVHARILVQHCGSASAVFGARSRDLERIEGIGTARAQAIRTFRGFAALEAEIDFIRRYDIRTCFLTDPGYPQRLLHCYDPPALLFFKGDPDLNASRTVSIVGTRNASDYGRRWTERFISGLAPLGITIISGLAFGIDAVAHKAALREGLPTIGVVGHGLARIYPQEHTAMARDMVRQGGGLLTEFLSETGPDKHHFPLRNRIVAGLSDCVVVVETAEKGGSMITARLADSYNRDVFAVPGRVGERNSSGCHSLIRGQKAQLLTNAGELIEAMGWEERPAAKPAQTALFAEYSENERRLLALLPAGTPVHIDELNIRSGMRTSEVAVLLLELELKGAVEGLPGKRYQSA
ncbi:DNA-protecting protein DprA [Flaviaesturariibacter flavus]|uniref:DNA-protecting protein DprA n=1 Tax=Flaviaesturariibacter flavus TaxID=2502780 RepID=A0A4R1B8J5_9BACT|nr:DNA-processing protein DprA [Flaviaesturariibacter flavus]TCJ13388.1 DNA-protecting protein DprA [Flaviaesturariibacter flavus]